ncbi:MAG: hypothetical protein LUE13_06640 [Akkermansiaceae bacterium]|nr:hypothetical protein [Akkermansiaceae bacterium]
MKIILQWMIARSMGAAALLVMGGSLTGTMLYGQPEPVIPEAGLRDVKDHPEKEGWVITPGKGWQKAIPRYDENDRKHYLGKLYDEMNIPQSVHLKGPEQKRNLFGLKWLDYYLVGGEEEEAWEFVDSLGEGYISFRIFYSTDKSISRKLGLDWLTVILKRPHENSRRYRYVVNEKGVGMVILEKQQYPFYAEKDGYSLSIHPYLGSISDVETRQLVEVILEALAGNQKFGYFPKRAQIIEKRNRLSSGERSRIIHDMKDLNKSMSPSARRALYKYWEEMVKKLNAESILKEAPKRETLPNPCRGIGTVTWIKKHMNIPFTPEQGNDGKHVDGITGTFFVRKGEREYPVEYMIAHLSSRDLAMSVLFSMQARKAVDAATEEEDIERVAEMTRVHPGLVGDYDLCLNPVLNDLGIPIPDSEQAWICFVRGNTAVMLKSLDLKVSVLPLAKTIDEALKKAVELYETPEVVR